MHRSPSKWQIYPWCKLYQLWERFKFKVGCIGRHQYLRMCYRSEKSWRNKNFVHKILLSFLLKIKLRINLNNFNWMYEDDYRFLQLPILPSKTGRQMKTQTFSPWIHELCISEFKVKWSHFYTNRIHNSKIIFLHTIVRDSKPNFRFPEEFLRIKRR